MRTLLQRFIRRRRLPEVPPREAIASIGEPFVSVLCSMYGGDPQLGFGGKTYPIDTTTRVWPRQGMALYQLVREVKPQNSLEIGLAYGFSTVYFLAAIQANGRGLHVAVDPFQLEYYHDIGVARETVLRVKPGTFEFIRETSLQALAQFFREQRQFDVIFIDGKHTFDGALIDFSLASLVCSPDAHIILDDMWMPSIQRVVSFIRLNRPDFAEVPTPDKRLAVFRQTDTDKRRWDHFVPF